MAKDDDRKQAQIAEAAWAHNRWPTIGLFSGAGIGLVLGVVTIAGLLKTLVYLVLLTVAGCAMGFFLARWVYGAPEQPSRDELEPDDRSPDER